MELPAHLQVIYLDVNGKKYIFANEYSYKP